MALATFAQVKDFLELKKSAITDYPTLGVLMKSMQSIFESYTSREFDLKERSEKFRTIYDNGESVFYLKGTPVSSVASVLVTSSNGDQSNLELGDDYNFDDQGVELLSVLTKGQSILITYTGGLIDQTNDQSFEATINGDLNLAAIQQISFQYQNRAKLAATSISLDSNSITIPSLNLLKYTTDILDRYKNMGTGF